MQNKRQSIAQTRTLTLGAILTAMVTLAISTNIVISLGMVGALSIVRFRTAIKEPKDLLFSLMIFGDDKSVVMFDDNQVTVLTSNILKTQVYTYKATMDSIYFTPDESILEQLGVDNSILKNDSNASATTYACSYYFKSNIKLVINGLNRLYDQDHDVPVQPVSLLRLSKSINFENLMDF